MQTNLTMEDLSALRAAVPPLDLVASRALRRAGYDLVHRDPEPGEGRSTWQTIPRPMTTSLRRPEAVAVE